MGKKTAFAFSLAAYGLFLACFTWLIAFLADVVVPRTVNAGGGSAGGGTALAVNLGLITAFGMVHSTMARDGFKRRWRRLVPDHLERTVFVLTATMQLAAILYFWQPMPEILWHIEHPILVTLLWGMFGLGWVLVLASTFAIDHFHFTGLSQTHAHLRGKPAAEPRFVTPLLYQMVRHPMMSGLLLGIWSTPTMTVGHLLFAGAFTAYMLVGIRFEERALLRRFGDDYRAYQARTPMLLPRLHWPQSPVGAVRDRLPDNRL